ncbi:MAG: LacI family DNA-binding transcriptional regulator [Chloroflexi bacterium]|nr:LacI family DNA-binding transcriptional regulator [Chloroflexota bacterium]
MPTLEDVAKKAGVSTATVSKVLSNTPYFTEATRLKVLQAVKDVGYVPNLAARALSSGRTQIIAVVFPHVYDPIFSDPRVLVVLEGIDAECRQRGYNLLLSTPRVVEGELDENYLQLIQSGYMDGVIALDHVPFAAVLEPVVNKGIAAVSIGGMARYSVNSDHYSGGRLLAQHLLELGHRNIGLIAVPEHINVGTDELMRGIRAGLRAGGLELDCLPQAVGDYSIDSGAACAATLLEQHPELTALLCLNDRMAMGALQQAHRLGRRVPADLSITGYDDIPAAASTIPPLTTVNQQSLTAGHEAARMLFDILDGQTPESKVIPVELVVRGSSGPAGGQ